MKAMDAARAAVCGTCGPKTDWQNVRHALRGWGTEIEASALEVILMRAFWPRIDAPVTCGTEHLIKFVWSPHKATGRICVPHAASMRLQDFFDPSTAPTMCLLAESTKADVAASARHAQAKRVVEESVRYAESVAQCLEDDLARQAKAGTLPSEHSEAFCAQSLLSAPKQTVVDLRAPLVAARKVEEDTQDDPAEVVSYESRVCFQTVTRLTLQLVDSDIVFCLQEHPQVRSAVRVAALGAPPYKDDDCLTDESAVVARCCQSARSLMETGEDGKRYWMASFHKVVFTNKSPEEINRLLAVVALDRSLERSAEALRVPQSMFSELGSLIKMRVMQLASVPAEWRPLYKLEELSIQAIALSPDLKLSCLRNSRMPLC